MVAGILVVAAVAALVLALFGWVIVVQQRTIRKQVETAETLRRACDRERAGREILESELRHVLDTAAVVTMWRKRTGAAS